MLWLRVRRVAAQLLDIVIQGAFDMGALGPVGLQPFGYIFPDKKIHFLTFDQ